MTGAGIEPTTYGLKVRMSVARVLRDQDSSLLMLMQHEARHALGDG